jgi:hypothetical protein
MSMRRMSRAGSVPTSSTTARPPQLRDGPVKRLMYKGNHIAVGSEASWTASKTSRSSALSPAGRTTGGWEPTVVLQARLLAGRRAAHQRAHARYVLAAVLYTDAASR